MPASARCLPVPPRQHPRRPRSGKSALALSLAGVGACPQNGSNLCAATLDGSPQSPSWEGAAVVPLDRQRGAQRLLNGPSSRCSENTKLLQTVFGHGSKLSLARALAAATSSSRPTTAAASWPVRFRGCLSAHSSGGTLTASTGMIAAGCAARCGRLREPAECRFISAVLVRQAARRVRPGYLAWQSLHKDVSWFVVDPVFQVTLIKHHLHQPQPSPVRRPRQSSKRQMRPLGSSDCQLGTP